MKKNVLEKGSIMMFVCLGLVNLASFFLFPFLGRTTPGGYGYSPMDILFGNGYPPFISPLESLIPIIVFALYILLSISFIIFGFTRLLSEKTPQNDISVTSNRNPFFILAVILLTVSLFAIPAFYINVELNLQIFLYAHFAIEFWGLYEIGFGTYTIFPLNALISFLYILWVILLPVKK